MTAIAGDGSKLIGYIGGGTCPRTGRVHLLPVTASTSEGSTVSLCSGWAADAPVEHCGCENGIAWTNSASS